MLEHVDELYPLESMEQLYSVEPIIEPIVFDPIPEPEPLPEGEVEIMDLINAQQSRMSISCANSNDLIEKIIDN